MHTDTTPQKKMPTRNGDRKVDNTTTQTVSNAGDTDKAFGSLRAAYVLNGHRLHRGDQSDSGAAYWAERWRLVKCLPTIDAARRLFEVIGGRL